MVTIVKANLQDVDKVCEISNKLWNHSDINDLYNEYNLLLNNQNCVVLFAQLNQKTVGFAQCQLRYDYVEGTSTSPVGYLEGIFVEKEYRNQGIAKLLLTECKTWAKEKHCTEFASDCELNNKLSIKFHEKCGFKIANKIVCFTQKL